MSDKVLLIGGGGREHAIAWKLNKSPAIAVIYALPGSAAMAQDVPKCVQLTNVDVKDFEAIGRWCLLNEIKLVVVGPEDPLADGLVDELNGKFGLPCFGPEKEAARIEADKSWSKDFMERHSIPTARYKSFTSVTEAKDFIRSAPYEALVVKASGLAAGKGVVVAETIDEACAAVDSILGNLKYGEAGGTIVVEEKLSGEEISLLAFVDGTTVRPMLPAQDHKRLGDNDQGPNTGGMGAYCPCPLITSEEMQIALSDVLQRAADGFEADGILYSGVLYAGLMLTKDGPKTLEFNCRFGDPETQVVLPLLMDDLYIIMQACASGRLANLPPIKWFSDYTAVGVIMASAGYPETSTKGCPITGLVVSTNDHFTFHSGTDILPDGTVVTNGGRVLINVELALTLEEAAARATAWCEQHIHFDGAQFRRDIAQKAFQAKGLSYKDSGVDIFAGDEMVQLIKPLAKRTHRQGVIGGLGGFGGLYRVNDLDYLKSDNTVASLVDPLFIEKTSGIGAKLRASLAAGKYETIGWDLVVNVANEVVSAGFQPFAFLDYVACNKLDVPLVVSIVRGISDGCLQARCSLLGGETAEMPALFAKGSYDLAGYCVGSVENGNEWNAQLSDGDTIVGFPARGLHCAGFEVIEAAMQRAGVTYTDQAPFAAAGRTFADELLVPIAIYVVPMLKLGNAVKRAVYVMDGGLEHNLAKLNLSDTPLTAELDGSAEVWQLSGLYGWLLTHGGCTNEEIRRTFNCGIGMLFVCDSRETRWQNQPGAVKIGQIRKRRQGEGATAVRGLNERFAALATEHFPKVPITDQPQGVHPHNACTLSESFVPNIRKQIATTHNPQVVHLLSGARALRLYPNGKCAYVDPVLVIGTDGIGSKILIAKRIEKFDTIGVDLVAMCVNDILCNGADALTFLDYYACGAGVPANIATAVLDGVVEGVRQSEGALIDGQTIELPTLYETGEFDLAGFALGIVESGAMLPHKDAIIAGDIVIGLPSDGVHSNGYSLVHKVMEVAGRKFTDGPAPFSATGRTYGEELLRPTRIYTAAVKPLLHRRLIKTIAHITGGGLLENIPRALPDNYGVELNFDRINIQPVFGWLSAVGNVNDIEMQRTYNCGIGLVLVVDNRYANIVLDELAAFGGQEIGRVYERKNQSTPAVRINAGQFGANMMRVKRSLTQPRKRVGVLISGTGSNLQALIEATRDSRRGTGSDIVCVISNKANAYGLVRAQQAGLPAHALSIGKYGSRDEYDAAVSELLASYNVDIVCLAGYMRIVGAAFVERWQGRLINIHPSLLPQFPGMHAQLQALQAGVEWSGCTVHFVDAGMDTGKVILQRKVAVRSDDTEETLTQRILVAEHLTYGESLRLVATGAVTY